MSLGGLIASALGGGARGYTEAARGELKTQQEFNLRKMLSEVEMEKQLAIDAIKRERDIADIPRRGAAQTNVEVDRQAALLPGEVARTTQVGQAQTDVEVGREVATRPGAVARAGELVDAQGAAARRSDAAYSNDPAARAGVRARATDSESPSARANVGLAAARNTREQAEFTRLESARKAAAEYHDAVDRGDDAAARAARRRGIEFGVDPAQTKRGALKVTEDEMGRKVLVHEDELGNVTRVDTERLPGYGGGKPAASSAPAAGAGAPKVGDTRTVQTGPHKDKTAVWDGNGWKLQGQ